MTARTGSLTTQTMFFGNFSRSSFASFTQQTMFFGNFSRSSFASFTQQVISFYPTTQARNGLWSPTFISGSDTAYALGATAGFTSGVGVSQQKEYAAFDDGVDDGYVEGLHRGIGIGLSTSAPASPNITTPTIRPVAGRAVTFVGLGSDSTPISTLTPTWTTYKDSVTNTTQGSPTISNLGGGNYKFTPTGTNPAGIIDLGAAASPRYLVYAARTSVWVFGVFSTAGVPLTGLTPTWNVLKRASDGSDYTPQPAISELGGGLYKTGLLAERVTGVIDLGASTSPRYLSHDNDRPTILVQVPAL